MSSTTSQLAELARRAKQRLQNPNPPEPSDKPAESWDAEYALGEWERLDTVDENARYMIILGQILLYGPKQPSVLDIGCGHGRFADTLQLSGPHRYHGVDFSARAIERAQALCSSNVTFEVADFNVWETDDKYDYVVYNECLNYFKNPLTRVTDSLRWMNPDGLLIISMYRPAAAKRTKLWKDVDRLPGIEAVSGCTVAAQNGKMWEIQSYRHA